MGMNFITGDCLELVVSKLSGYDMALGIHCITLMAIEQKRHDIARAPPYMPLIPCDK